MRRLYVDSLGTFTSVGINVPQTMGSLRTAYARHHETALFRANQAPLVAAPTPIPSDAAQGDQRLVAMGAFALRECAAPRPAESLPLLLCLPVAVQATATRIFSEMARHAGVRVDTANSRIYTGGQATIASALADADALLAAGQVSACVVGGVDSLLDLRRLASLFAEDRVKSSSNSDGFIPGEGAAFLCLSRQRTTTSIAWLRGLAVSQEPTIWRGDPPNTAQGLSAALKLAVRDGSVTHDEIAFSAHAGSGERFFFNEFALAAQRLRILRPGHMQSWTPGVSVGEIGVAGGALTLAYLAFAIKAGILAGHQDDPQHVRTGVLCAFQDTDSLRGAAFVNEVPRG